MVKCKTNIKLYIFFKFESGIYFSQPVFMYIVVKVTTQEINNITHSYSRPTVVILRLF